MGLGNFRWELALRMAAVLSGAVGLAALAPACSSDDGGGTGTAGFGGFGGSGASGGAAGAGATGGVGATGGGGSSGASGAGGSGGCPGGQVDCSGVCTNTQFDPGNCGTCGTACGAGEFCSQGTCNAQCLGSTLCNGACVNTDTDPANCGTCGTACATGEVCSVGVCGVQCTGGATKCGNACTNTQSDPANCGACGTACTGGQVCSAGACTLSCGTGLTKCGNSCVDVTNDKNNCGACGTVCPGGQACLNGTCGACDTATQDCDGDGWAGTAQGDCCEVPGPCGASPALVNPGAIEVEGNGLDDNCNGKKDLFDLEDTIACDSSLGSSSTNAKDYAKAMGICRETSETPATPKDKTWGLISAEILRADGSPLGDVRARSIRSGFGSVVKPVQGQSLVVLSSGIAADSTQTNPGPSNGSSGNVSTSHTPSSTVSLTSGGTTASIKDWFSTANPPLKTANSFPEAPNCGSGNFETDANDSVMLRLRLRAPTNARAFSFNSYFYSAEYPEFVCTSFNDMYIALVDTPGGTPQPIPNPNDKNLLTYLDAANEKWPVGINVAAGTTLFAVCDPAQTTGTCLSGGGPIAAGSCSLGFGDLAGTGFELTDFSSCKIGGGTHWLTTAGNVIPGQIVEIRIAIFDVGDWSYDSHALIDGFDWLSNTTLAGTN